MFKKILLLSLLALALNACSTNKKPAKPTTKKTTSTQTQAKKVRITHVSARQGGQEVMMYAMSLMGIGYKFGGTNPQAGFDCSGMVGYIYKNALGVQLPRTAADIAAASTTISKSQLKVGDLVFFNTNGKPFSHMGIYIGDNRFVHAPSTNGSIRTASLDNQYFASRFTSARTLFAK
ncbi:C40 family peptidase [Neisseria sp. Ec49-e6-T10]|uniref:C40 family peptidase n=1 Tax=Neisseria sp. Ec49-e6-T10 TaxID=3140744 RepID=UPI003EBC7A86